jgi:nucleoside 2-deoxyribosyltransferase
MRMRHRLQAYFAAPLFNEMERSFNASLVSRLEQSVDVFLPQRDGGLLLQMIKQGIPPDTAETSVFEKDCAAIDCADLLVAVLDGAGIDEGVAFEIGYAFGLGKYCVGLQTDVRRALPTGNNPMIGRALRTIFSSCEELISWMANESSSALKTSTLNRSTATIRMGQNQAA